MTSTTTAPAENCLRLVDIDESARELKFAAARLAAGVMTRNKAPAKCTTHKGADTECCHWGPLTTRRTAAEEPSRRFPWPSPMRSFQIWKPERLLRMPLLTLRKMRLRVTS